MGTEVSAGHPVDQTAPLWGEHERLGFVGRHPLDQLLAVKAADELEALGRVQVERPRSMGEGDLPLGIAVRRGIGAQEQLLPPDLTQELLNAFHGAVRERLGSEWRNGIEGLLLTSAWPPGPPSMQRPCAASLAA